MSKTSKKRKCSMPSVEAEYPFNLHTNVAKGYTHLGELEKLLNIFLDKHSNNENLDEDHSQVTDGESNSVSHKPKVKLLMFGSYRLGVYDCESDLDTLCIIPRHCMSRSEFFEKLPSFLRNIDDISNMLCVPSSFCPVLKFEFHGMKIDMLFCGVDEEIVDDSILLEDSILIGMEQPDIIALNGYRTTEKLISMMEEISRLDLFRKLLRVIKSWSKSQGLYSNVLGFFGGINLALMAAFICETYYREERLDKLVFYFFRVFSRWEYNKILKLNPAIRLPSGTSIAMKSYLPNTTDAFPILTPVFPTMNSFHNCNPVSWKIIMDCLKNADRICSGVISGRNDYSSLWSGRISDSVDNSTHFLLISLSSSSTEEMLAWRGYMETRMRRLFTDLSRLPQVLEIRPIPCWLDSDESFLPHNRHESELLIALTCDMSEDVLFNRVLTPFESHLRSWTNRTETMDIVMNAYPPEVIHSRLNSLDIQLTSSTTQCTCSLAAEEMSAPPSPKADELYTHRHHHHHRTV
eukprot:TRINITY_DN6283_c0_g1_i1.p1 TRINITY_DN6283_c0_g1~~TRINITY_DN6283_c0_g1_i1.p1  ORF type:complete len:520 (-),score=91.51 TRINITY_DN6283_c0_g1_i1:1582-3141(-)